MNRKRSKLTAFLLTLAMIFVNLGFGSVSEVSATETDGTTAENITVTMNFDCSSLGTEEALKQMGKTVYEDSNYFEMPSITVEVPIGSNVYEALEAAADKSNDIILDRSKNYIDSAYGLGTGADGTKGLIGFGTDNEKSGWMFYVDDVLSKTGAISCKLERDTRLDFRYAWDPKNELGAYDWDFVDAYNDLTASIKSVEKLNESDYTEDQWTALKKIVNEAEAIQEEINTSTLGEDFAVVSDVCNGFWAGYYRTNPIWGSEDSITSRMQKADRNLQKAISKEVNPIGIEVDNVEYYAGEIKKIPYKVVPEGATQEVAFEVTEISGKADVDANSNLICKKEGLILLEITSKADPSVKVTKPVTIKSAPLYNITFTSKEANIKADDVTLKDSSGKVIKPEGEVFALTKGKYTYEINVKGKDKRIGTLVVNDETFTINTDKAEEVVISYDNSAEAKAYKETAEYLQKNLVPDYNDWVVMGLARSGKLTEKQAKEYYKNTADYIKSLENDRPYATDYARCIIGLTAAGWDVTDVAGKNLLSYLSDMDFAVKNGINGAVYTLIAYDTHDYEIPEAGAGKSQTTRDALVKYILDKQKADGGWNWDDNAAEADIDITAMTLQALAPYYKDNNDVKDACDKAVKVLSEKQEIDGTYISWEMKSASTSAEVITALTALGIDPDNDARFVKNGNSIIDGLNSLSAKGGGYVYDTDEANEFSSRSGYYAMVSYYRYIENENALYDMTDVTLKSNPDSDNNGTNPSKPGNGNGDVNNGSENGNIGNSDSINQGNAGEVETGDGFPLKTVILILLVALVGTIAGLSTGKKN